MQLIAYEETDRFSGWTPAELDIDAAFSYQPDLPGMDLQLYLRDLAWGVL